MFLDAQATKRFPLPLPDPKDARVHLVLVVHGVAERCVKHFGGGSGSLSIQTDIKGVEDHTEPFKVGDLNPEGAFVHVLDDTTLEILLKNRDTISDFTAYLRKKEQFLRSKPVFAAGEEDLLAFYLRDMNEANEHDFPPSPEATHVGIKEGVWARYCVHPQRHAQIAADEVSYVWDRLIEQFNVHALAGTQHFVSAGGFSDSERIVRFMAREPRTRRRMLGGALIDMLETTPASARRIRFIQPSLPGDPYFVFVLLPYLHDRPYEENRTFRREYLEVVTWVVKHLNPDALDIVGVATESGLDHEQRSEDALWLDARSWTPEMDAEAERLRKRLNILTNVAEHRSIEKEYPDPA